MGIMVSPAGGQHCLEEGDSTVFQIIPLNIHTDSKHIHSTYTHSYRLKGADTAVSLPPVESQILRGHTPFITTEGVGHMTKTQQQKKQKEEADQAIEKRWGKALTSAGWTAIPNILFERGQELGLKTLDIVIILHLAGYWWKAGNDPYPSKETLAKAIGVEPRTVQRRIAAMEEKKFIQRIERKSAKGGNLSNKYSFAGLIKAATPMANASLAEREERKKAASGRPARKSTSKLELVKT